MRTRNVAQCPMCLEVIESKYRHDFVQCGCENQCFVDGGQSYFRRGWKYLPPTPIENTEDYPELD